MPSLRGLADPKAKGSLSNRLRARRFRLFESLVEPLEKPVRILDVGGTPAFWAHRGWADRDDARITVVNLEPEVSAHDNIETRQGDARDLSEYADDSFDVVLSNSVIEHLFTLDAQRAMADEVRRVGRAYWVQTPNFWFPVEPHFLTPAWHWLPASVRVALLRRWRFGHRGPYPEREQAQRQVDEVRLMSRRELSELFPDATIVPERFAGLVKSWIVHAGFPGTLESGAPAG